MLLPLTALEGKFRQSLYKKYGVQVILFNKRVNYQVHQNKNSCWFASAWFCYKLNLPKDLNFVELNDGNNGIPPKPKVLGILPTII